MLLFSGRPTHCRFGPGLTILTECPACPPASTLRRGSCPPASLEGSRGRMVPGWLFGPLLLAERAIIESATRQPASGMALQACRRAAYVMSRINGASCQGGATA